MEFITRTKRWGSSIGVVLPKPVIEETGLKPDESIVLEIKRKHKAKEFFGLLKDWKKSEQILKEEARKGW